jgi:hypothetical protein
MKKYLFLFFCVTAVARAALITGFGTGEFTAAVPFGTDSQTALTYSISGSDNSSLYGAISAVPSLGSITTIYLTGTLTFATNPATNFQIGLYDSDGDGRLYQANWSSFSSSTVEKEIILSFIGLDNSGTGGFSGTATTLALIGGGTGTSTINFVLNTLSTTSAVPEPATYAALFGLAALGFGAVRRRRKA